MPAGRAGKIKIKQPLDLKFTQNDTHKMLLFRIHSLELSCNTQYLHCKQY